MKRGNCKMNKNVRTARGHKLSISEEEWNAMTKSLVESSVFQKGPNMNDGKWWNQVYAISLELPLDKDRHCINNQATVNIKGVEGSFFKLDRFDCWVYDDALSPMLISRSGCRKYYGRSGWVTIDVPCDIAWKQGTYTLLVYDDDDDSLIRIIFSLDKDVKPQIAVFRSSRPFGDGVYKMRCSYKNAQEFTGEDVITESTDVDFELSD